VPGKTKIEWATDTWNPTTGCDRVSPGCDNCYALSTAARLKAMGVPAYQKDGGPKSGPGFGLSMHESRLDQPLRWTKPRRIFVNSMSDLFHPEVTDEFIAKVFAVMAGAPQHTFQILTKRPQRMANLLSTAEFEGLVNQESLGGPVQLPLANVWLGTSIESDAYAFRARHLARTPAALRFLSCEPLLGPVSSLNLSDIDWVIVGGESGSKARAMHPAWVLEIKELCENEGVAFFFKQWGEWAPRGRLSDTEPLPVDNAATLILNVDGNTRGRAGGSLTNALSTFSDGSWCEVLERAGKAKSGREFMGEVFDAYPAAVPEL
jgi:protein gp37